MKLFLLFLTTFSIPTTHAWGKDGHAIIAAIAQDHLSPTALKGVLHLLQANNPPASNLSAIASWADQMTHTKEFAWTEPLHFTNVQDSSKKCLVNGEKGGYGNCTFNYLRDCVDRDGNNPGFCNAGAIANFTSILTQGVRNKSTSTATVQALKFVVHFVGDIMQPLHCGMLLDHGGVYINVKFPVAGGQGSSWNLHNIWDFGLIVNNEGVEGEYLGLVNSIQTQLNSGSFAQSKSTWMHSIDPKNWVQESLNMATKYAYRFANGTDIRRTHSRTDFVILGDSVNEYMKTGGIIEEQLAKAGVRLAVLLNNIFDTKSKPQKISTSITTPINKPHFSGMFFAMTPLVTMWTVKEWIVEFTYMKAAGFKFVVIPHTGRQINTSTTTCMNGTFQVYYPVNKNDLNPNCYTQIGNLKTKGGTLGAAFEAATSVGLDLHLGLLFAPAEHGFPEQHVNNTYLEWADQQYEAAKALYHLYGATNHLVGFYTEIEESNSNYWLSIYGNFSTYYWERIGSQIKQNLNSELVVWASPYSIGNLTRHPTDFSNTSMWQKAWKEIFINAPSLDFVSPQDSMGAQGNSFENASEYLQAVVKGGLDAQRSVPQWSNVELFEVWPRSCEWPSVCHGRHPASFEGRIKQQMHNEANIISPKDGGASAVLIAWEWRSCFSPNAFGDSHIAFPNVTKSNYEAYMSYLKE